MSRDPPAFTLARMAERKITITFLGDAKGAVNAVADIDGKLGGLGKTLGDVGKTAAGFVLGQGLMAAPGFLIDAAKAAAEDQAATDRLNQALENYVNNTGDFERTGVTAAENFAKLKGSVDGLIASGQKLAFTDDDIRDGFQFLLSATGDADEATRRLAAAQDLARGANIPLATATKMLGKLNGENVEVFKKMGITLGENATEADALAAVQQRFGGQAEKYAKSTAGQFEQLQIRLAEAKETLGTALLPIMTALGEIVATKVLPAIEKLAAAVGPVLSEIGAVIGEKVLPPLQSLGEWFTGNADAMAAAGGAAAAILVVAFTTWAIAAGAAALATIAAAAPVIALGLVLAALGAGIVLLVTHWDDLTAKYPPLAAASEAVKAAFAAFTSWIGSDFVPTVKSIADTFTQLSGDVQRIVGDLWQKVKPIVEGGITAIKVVVDTYMNQIKVVIETVLGVIQGVFDVFVGVFTGDWSRAWSGLQQIVTSIWGGIKGSIENAIGLIQGLAPLIMAAGAALGSALLDGLKNALSSSAGFAGDVGQAVVNAIRAVVNTQIDRLNSLLEFTIPVKGLPDIHIDAPDIGHLALGGMGGGIFRVGEFGPETLFLPRGARVAADGGRGAAGGINFNGPVIIHAESRERALLAAGDFAQGLRGKLARAGGL